jgi:integrase
MSRNGNLREKLGEFVTLLRRGRKYYAEFMSGGRQIRRSLRTNYVEVARAQALDLDQELRKGSYQEVPDPPLRELVRMYLEHCKNEGRRPRTVGRYTGILKRFLIFCEARGIQQSSRIDLLVMEAYRAVRLKDGVSERARYMETMTVKQLLKWAEQRSLIPANRLKGMHVGKPPTSEQPCFTLEEVEQVLDVSPPQDRAAFALLAFTGMRVGELQWLTWHDVDFFNGFIHVRAKDSWRPKNGRDRAIPMHPRIRESLEQLSKKHRWVLTARKSKKFPKGGHQISPVHLLEKLKAILRKVGIAEGKLHSFRHFFISHCANQGVPPTIVMKWVGHSELRMITRYYELRQDESKRAMEGVDFGKHSSNFRTVLGQKGGCENEPRSQLPALQVVTSAVS